MIRHIVALRFRKGTTAQTKQAPYPDLRGLAGHVGGILDFQSFSSIPVEPAQGRGFDDLFLFDCRDVGVRDACLAYPAHQAIGARIGANLEGGAEGVVVFDLALP